MARGSRRERRPAASSAARAAAGAPRPAPLALPWRSPWLLLAAAAAFGSILVSITYRIDDPDLWQHLAVGRWVWVRHALPTIHEWTWPLWGTREVNSSWGFEALLWPFWDRGGLVGLFLWRWLTTLAAFAFLWAAARRMGARGLAPAFVFALCALTYRLRSDLRPETLSAVLFAASLWILETRRHGGPDRTPWLVLVAWIWANTHVSWYLGLATIALYLGEAAWVAARAGAPSRTPSAAGSRPPAPQPPADRGGDPRGVRKLALVAAAAIAVSFLNPSGWRGLAEPFQYALVWRHEPVFQNIPELMPPRWQYNWRNGLPLLMAGWVGLALWRSARVKLDRVELVIMATFTAQALLAQRFLGTYALGAALFVSRDLGEWLARRGADPPRLPLPVRAGLVAAGCFAIGALEWRSWELPLGIAMDHASYVMRACDFMERHGVRGRGLNNFGMSGWQIFRFWPDRGRLPFIDVHVSGTREDRDLYAFAQRDSLAWARLDAKHRFDYVLLPRVQFPGDQLLNTLDADPAFALVFKDDAGALFVRRGGALAPVADSFAYQTVPAGNRATGRLGAACAADSALRGRVRVELAREIRESPWHGQALSLLANLALLEARWPEARALLDSVRAIDERRPRLYQRLGMLDLVEGRPREALRHFAREVEIHGASAEMDLAEGQAWAVAGRSDRAAAAARRALKREPGNAAAADSLAAWERRSR